MLPRVTVECRLAADPELRFSQSGTAVARLRVVASDRKRDDNGEWVDSDTLWLDVTCFNKLAENVVESVQKGDLLIVHGKIRTEEWEDRESGQKRSKIAMIADKVGADLTFRVLPHGGETHARRADQRPAPSASAGSGHGGSWGQGEEPPF